jgi:hypothetical protein
MASREKKSELVRPVGETRQADADANDATPHGDGGAPSHSPLEPVA